MIPQEWFPNDFSRFDSILVAASFLIPRGSETWEGIHSFLIYPPANNKREEGHRETKKSCHRIIRFHSIFTVAESILDRLERKWEETIVSKEKWHWKCNQRTRGKAKKLHTKRRIKQRINEATNETRGNFNIEIDEKVTKRETMLIKIKGKSKVCSPSPLPFFAEIPCKRFSFFCVVFLRQIYSLPFLFKSTMFFIRCRLSNSVSIPFSL
jgi:hypothetical protein